MLSQLFVLSKGESRPGPGMGRRTSSPGAGNDTGAVTHDRKAWTSVPDGDSRRQQRRPIDPSVC
jgi:hypothetical protein